LIARRIPWGAGDISRIARTELDLGGPDLEVVAGGALTCRVLGWVPDNLADAIRLMEYGFEQGDIGGFMGSGMGESLLAGLRIIGGPPAIRLPRRPSPAIAASCRARPGATKFV
jgi:hypothetical protein